jgi:nitrite reductase/ring-hydroxylating ferredoxin subunit
MAEAVDWIPVLAASELRDGKGVQVGLETGDVLLVRAGDVVFAVANHCTHQGAPLHRGTVSLTGSLKTVTCPVHGSMFGLEDGRVVRGPAARPLVACEARIAGDAVEVRPRS